jgi:Phosphoinositide 3-kinase family, accessory domain (PIK domain)
MHLCLRIVLMHLCLRIVLMHLCLRIVLMHLCSRIVQIGKDNPAELKAQKLARSCTRGIIDHDLKPNSEERKRISQVLKLPPNKVLHVEDKALLWRFRFSLTQDKRALTKFLKCVDWSDVSEAKQAGAHIACSHTGGSLQ